MAGTSTLGKALKCNIERTEDDTNNITVKMTNPATGALVDTTGFTGTLSIDFDPVDDSADSTFAGTGLGVSGLVEYDMGAFAAPIGSHAYDILIVDAAADSRKYVFGTMKVVERIGT